MIDTELLLATLDALRASDDPHAGAAAEVLLAALGDDE